MTQMNHYFYDHQGDIVDQWLGSDIKIQRGESILFSKLEPPCIYLVQAVLHVQGEAIAPENHNWLVNRVSKVIINQPYIDTSAPRQPLPLKAVQGYQQS